MTTSVSSWFIDQTKKGASEPHRRLLIGTSDYSSRVTKWPSIKRSVTDLKSTSVNIPLANDDGNLNGFYLNTYNLPKTINLEVGYDVVSGCIGHWKFDTGSGSTAYDSSSWENNGTLEGSSCEWAPDSGYVGGALYFPGNNERVDCGDGISVGSGDFSISLWINMDASSNYGRLFYKTDHAEDYFGLYKVGSTGYTRFIAYKDVLSSANFIDLNPFDDEWHNLVFVKDGYTGRLYMDIIPSSVTVDLSGNPLDISNIGNLAFGADDAGTGPAKGYFDSIRVFNRALTQSEINFLYDNPHSPTYNEYLDIFTGRLRQVSYGNQKCTLKVRDTIWDFSQRKVGDSETPVICSEQIPTDIAWTLCTCYGMLDDTASISNVDINYTSFLNWASTISSDNIVNEARYEGAKVIDALNRLCKMNDSVVWVDGDGRLNFRRCDEVSSLDLIITRDERLDMEINIDDDMLKNKYWVGFDYAPGSSYWASTVFDVNSQSVNSFGLHDGYLRDETIWFTNSASALNRAQREVQLFGSPPKIFDIDTGLMGLEHGLTETVRLVESFYNITSDAGWRITDQNINMDSGLVSLTLNGATTLAAFYLDISSLDGDEYLL